MKIKYLTVFIFLLTTANIALAQNTKPTKQEKREYRKKAKELRKEFKTKYKNPEQFSDLKKENSTSQTELNKLKIEAERLKSQEKVQAEQLASLKQMQEDEQAKLDSLQTALKNKPNAKPNKGKVISIPSTGVFYAVHVGDASAENLAQILSTSDSQLSIDHDAKGRSLYLIGLFPQIQAAQALKAQIVAMGMTRSNVVMIKDGKVKI